MTKQESNHAPKERETHKRRMWIIEALFKRGEIDIGEIAIEDARFRRHFPQYAERTGMHTDDLDAICAQLVDCANSRGGEDNITVVLVRYEKETG